MYAAEPKEYIIIHPLLTVIVITSDYIISAMFACNVRDTNLKTHNRRNFSIKLSNEILILLVKRNISFVLEK